METSAEGFVRALDREFDNIQSLFRVPRSFRQGQEGIFEDYRDLAASFSHLSLRRRLPFFYMMSLKTAPHPHVVQRRSAAFVSTDQHLDNPEARAVIEMWKTNGAMTSNFTHWLEQAIEQRYGA